MKRARPLSATWSRWPRLPRRTFGFAAPRSGGRSRSCGLLDIFSAPTSPSMPAPWLSCSISPGGGAVAGGASRRCVGRRTAPSRQAPPVLVLPATPLASMEPPRPPCRPSVVGERRPRRRRHPGAAQRQSRPARRGRAVRRRACRPARSGTGCITSPPPCCPRPVLGTGLEARAPPRLRRISRGPPVACSQSGLRDRRHPQSTPDLLRTWPPPSGPGSPSGMTPCATARGSAGAAVITI